MIPSNGGKLHEIKNRLIVISKFPKKIQLESTIEKNCRQIFIACGEQIFLDKCGTISSETFPLYRTHHSYLTLPFFKRFLILCHYVTVKRRPDDVSVCVLIWYCYVLFWTILQFKKLNIHLRTIALNPSPEKDFMDNKKRCHRTSNICNKRYNVGNFGFRWISIYRLYHW